MVHALDILIAAAAAVNAEHFTPPIGMKNTSGQAMKNMCAVSSTRKTRFRANSLHQRSRSTALPSLKRCARACEEEDATIECYRAAIDLLPLAGMFL